MANYQLRLYASIKISNTNGLLSGEIGTTVLENVMDDDAVIMLALEWRGDVLATLRRSNTAFSQLLKTRLEVTRLSEHMTPCGLVMQIEREV